MRTPKASQNRSRILREFPTKMLSECNLTCRRVLHRRHDAAAHIAEADSIAVTLAPAGYRECVAIFEPFTRFAVWKLQYGSFNGFAPRQVNSNMQPRDSSVEPLIVPLASKSPGSKLQPLTV